MDWPNWFRFIFDFIFAGLDVVSQEPLNRDRP